MRCSIAGLGVGFVAFSGPTTTSAEPIPEFHAFYRNVDDPASGSSDVSLSYDSAEKTYTLVIKTVDDMAREYVSRLRFDLVDDEVRPLSHREEHGQCLSCTMALAFDWYKRRYAYDSRGYQHMGSLTERDGGPSDRVREVAMLVAHLPGRRELATFDDVLTEKSLGTVELTTALGTVHADGRALRGTRNAAVWLAPELDQLPVRIVAFGMGLELAELEGIELVAARGTTASEVGVTTSPLAPAGIATTRIPEYRAVYRVDENRRVGTGRFETAVSYDRASDSYELVATGIETRHPEDVLVLTLPFRVLGDRVQPLGLHLDEGGRRARTMDIDWTMQEVVIGFDGRARRYPFGSFQDPDDQGFEGAMIEQLAQLLAVLPGHPAIVGFDDVLSSESLGAAEVSLPMGSFSVEGRVLRGDSEDISLEVWQARELGDLPVRFLGPVMARRATTMELIELYGIERPSTPATP